MSPTGGDIAAYDKQAERLHRVLFDQLPLFAWHVDNGTERLTTRLTPGLPVRYALDYFGVEVTMRVNGVAMHSRCEELVIVMDSHGVEAMARHVRVRVIEGLIEAMTEWRQEEGE